MSTETNPKEESRPFDPTVLHKVGEHFAAGYMEALEEPPVLRMARGVRAYLSHCELPPWRSEPLYPAGPSLWHHGAAVEYHYSSCLSFNRPLLLEKLNNGGSPELHAALQATDAALRDYPPVGGYTHSIPHYGRILREGLNGYRQRIDAGLAHAEALGDAERIDFYRAMQIVWEGVQALHRRALAWLRAARGKDEEEEARRLRLLDALKRVPFQPARTFYEALVGTNFIFYVDGSDDLGRFDQDLWPYYERDRREGRLRREEALAWVRQMWANVDACTGWNAAIGGTKPDGTSAINDLTLVCLEAAHSRRRPNLALRLRSDAPEEVWDAALDCIATGCGLPALYNEEAYLRAIRDAHLNVPEADLAHFAFGGCTELMIHGRSNVGSLDGDLNLPQILVGTLHQSLAGCADFESFVATYKQDLREHIRQLTDQISANQECKARYQPQVVRSLLIDDCIENGREYNAGGARYNWSVVNVMGLANVVDSLAAVREVVYEKREVTAEELLTILGADFAGHEPFRKRLEQCPRFGNDDPRADDLAADLSEFVFREFLRAAPWRGGRFIPACLMFTTYALYGEPVGATPDGRHAGQPIADSAGAMQGRDRNGPTALIRSVTRIPHHLAPGTLVVNARFAQSFFRNGESRAKLKDLIRSYFRLGGMQLQINVVDQAVLRDAIAHPERHGDLIIRVGGYSEYFNVLSDALKQSILERTEHEG